MEEQFLVSKESEISVLGTCLNNNDLMSKVLETLTIEDFGIIQNKDIFTLMVEMYALGESFDAMVLYTKYPKAIVDAGGLAYLSDLTGYNNKATLEHHIKVIKKMSDKRKLVSMKKILDKCFKDDVDPSQVISEVNDVVTKINSNSKKSILSAADVTEMTLEEIEIAHNSCGSVGKSTGYYKLDDMFNGLKKVDYIVIGARPSMGKTAFVLNILNKLKSDTNTLLVQCDMSLTDVGARLFSLESQIQSGKISRGRLSESEFEKVARVSAHIANKSNLMFMDESNPTVGELYTKCKALKDTTGLDVLIIDHIGKIKADKPTGNDYVDTSYVSNGLKKLAKDLDVCVVALCQLSRKTEMRADKRPMLSDLRDSGKIEEDADIICFLYRDGYYSEREGKEKVDKDVLELSCQKNRNGKIGNLYFDYYLGTQVISER